jgi:iron complex outermembrane receptor protein
MKHRFLAHASALAAVTITAFALVSPALAQGVPDNPATEAPEGTARDGSVPPAVDDETIVVTGSLIRGTPEDAALPVDLISAEELAKQGSPTLLELVRNLPTSSGIIGESNQFDARAQGTEGVAGVNLRGLGPSRTLVLLNGRRFAPIGIGVPQVDVNMIPPGAIGRVEVLKDGAGSTYGSDAVAGVVNFITKQDLQGLLVSGDYRYIDGSKGDWGASVTFGHSQEGFRVLLSGGYQHRSELRVTDRDYAVRPYAENPQGGFTGGGNPGNFDFNLFDGVGQFVSDPGCASLGGFLSPPAGTPGVTVPNRCFTQFTGFGNLVEKEDRFQIYAEVGVDITDRMTFEVSSLYGRTNVPQWATSPTYLPTQPPSAEARNFPGTQIRLPNGALLTPPPGVFTIPGNNPGLVALRNTFGAAAGPQGSPAIAFPLLFRSAFLGGNPLFPRDGRPGPSRGKRESDAFRATAELGYELSDGLNIDAGVTYSRYERFIRTYDTFGDIFQLALSGLGGPNCRTPTPGQNGCQFFNPFSNAVERNVLTGEVNPNFNAALANDPELFRTFFVPSDSYADTELLVADVVLSGKTGFELGGGAVGFALGAQYRKDTHEVRYGANNNLLVNPCPGSVINRNATCSPQTGALGFLGTNLPSRASQDVQAVFGEVQVPFTDAINLQFAARYEDYGGAVGATFDPQVRARWQITDWLAVRGGVGTTFRGPPPQFLDTGSVTSLQPIGTAFRAIDIFGNPDLKPEKATTYSGGVLFDAGGLSLSVDYFRFDFEGPQVAEPVAGFTNALFGATGNANCGNPAFAALQARFTFTGAGCGIANVARLRTQYINGADVRTSGIDVLGQYEFEFGASSLAVGANATYTLEYETDDQFIEGVLVTPAFDAVGKLNFQTTAYPLPRVKGQAYIDAEIGNHTGRLQVNYVHSYTDQRGAAVFGVNPQLGVAVTEGRKIDNFITTDFTYRLTLPGDAAIALSVLNIFDEDPPFARLEQNYDPFTHSPIGRNFKVTLTKEF